MLIFNGNLVVNDFYKIIFENKSIEIAGSTIKKVEESFNFLKTFSANKVIYGVNTASICKPWSFGIKFWYAGRSIYGLLCHGGNQTLSNPMYVHSNPNNDNQDIVSMGTNAALMTRKVVENAFEVLAIEIITIVQSIEYLKIQDKVSLKTKQMYDDIRNIVPIFTTDVVMYPYVNQVKDHIINNKLN